MGWPRKVIFAKYNITDENLEHATSSELDIFLRKFHEVRYEQYQRKLISDIKDDNKKLTVYKLIKNDYRIEPHLIYLNNKKNQRALTRLRVSSHKLNIELGRHSRPPIPRANRLCNFCNSKEFDDEIHFLTKCEFHSEARYHMFDEIQRHQHVSQNLSPENLYQCVMTSKSDKVLVAIAKFTYFGFKRRDNFTEGWYLIYPIQILIIQILVYFPSVILGLWETTVKTLLSGYYCFNRTTLLVSAISISAYISNIGGFLAYMPSIHWSGEVVVLAGFSSLAALEVVKMTTFSAVGGGGLVGVAAFPLQCQWICIMIMFYPAPTDGRYSNGLRCLILLYVFNFKVYVFYILVTLVSVLLRPTTSLLWLILSVPMCIDVTMCMLMLLFYDSCAMLALYVSIKFLLTSEKMRCHKHSFGEF